MSVLPAELPRCHCSHRSTASASAMAADPGVSGDVLEIARQLPAEIATLAVLYEYSFCFFVSCIKQNKNNMSVLPAELPVAEPPVVLLVDSDSEKDETLAEPPAELPVAELPVAELPVAELPVVLLVDSDSEKPDEMPTFIKEKHFKKPAEMPTFARDVPFANAASVILENVPTFLRDVPSAIYCPRCKERNEKMAAVFQSFMEELSDSDE